MILFVSMFMSTTISSAILHFSEAFIEYHGTDFKFMGPNMMFLTFKRKNVNSRPAKNKNG